MTGASSGIGLELAEQLASAGLNLVLNSRRQDVLEKLSTSLQSKFGVSVRAVGSDLSSQEGVQKLIAQTKDLDVGLLVANAGYGTSGLFVASSLTEELNMLKVNCEALFSLTHYFGRIFKQRNSSGIILMSSIVGFQGVPYAAHYAATKAYVQSLAEALAIELKPLGIDVLAPAPAPVDSGFAARANMQMGMSLKPSDIGAPILKALGRQSSVLPGSLSKLLVYALRTVPRFAKIRIMKLVMGGMTRHQRETLT